MRKVYSFILTGKHFISAPRATTQWVGMIFLNQLQREEAGQGRKLGFISQEIGREINTLGSKANHAEMQKLVVQMKDALEKIKEQVLNVW